MFAGKILVQTVGVPMGSACSPMIADLTLTSLEFLFMSDSKNAQLARQVKVCRRYVDDIVAINCPDFLEIAKQIYPNTIPLQRTSEEDCNNACFLDLDVHISEGQPSFKLYDKTRDFPFKVKKFGHIDSNVTRNLTLSVLYTQLVRYERILASRIEFGKEVKRIVNYLVKEAGYGKTELIETFLRFLKDRPHVAIKFNLKGKNEVAAFITLYLR